ncbi:MAG: hypothetical protein ABSB77_03430 [Xanthobacteraceae bacterium]|jgi:hypothetical protein
MIADVLGYAKFTQIAPGVYARAMQYEFLFIFQKGIRAAIELRAKAIGSDAATRRSALF